MTAPKITVNKKNYLLLRKHYKKAVENKWISFRCFGVDLLTDYAKYLLEYMEIVLKIDNKKDQKK